MKSERTRRFKKRIKKTKSPWKGSFRSFFVKIDDHKPVFIMDDGDFER